MKLIFNFKFEYKGKVMNWVWHHDSLTNERRKLWAQAQAIKAGKSRIAQARTIEYGLWQSGIE